VLLVTNQSMWTSVVSVITARGMLLTVLQYKRAVSWKSMSVLCF